MRATFSLFVSAILLLLAAVYSQKRMEICCMPDSYSITKETEHTEYLLANAPSAVLHRKNVTTTTQKFLDVANNKSLSVVETFSPDYRKDWDLYVYDAPRSRFVAYYYNQTRCVCYPGYFPITPSCFAEDTMDWKNVRERTIGEGMKVKTYQFGYRFQQDPSIKEKTAVYTFTFNEEGRCIPISHEVMLNQYGAFRGHESMNTAEMYYDFNPKIVDPSVFDIPKHCPAIETCNNKQSHVRLAKQTKAQG